MPEFYEESPASPVPLNTSLQKLRILGHVFCKPRDEAKPARPAGAKGPHRAFDARRSLGISPGSHHPLQIGQCVQSFLQLCELLIGMLYLPALHFGDF